MEKETGGTPAAGHWNKAVRGKVSFVCVFVPFSTGSFIVAASCLSGLPFDAFRRWSIDMFWNLLIFYLS